jgi:hypothetical protein
MTALDIKSELLRLVETLPPEQQAQILEFACFLHEQTRAEAIKKVIPPPRIVVRPLPATTLTNLTGVVALGGDAVADTEALYGSDCRS